MAVITGAGSGIGRALALVCAEKNMRLVLADVDSTCLEQTRSLLSKTACEVECIATDVSDSVQMEHLAEQSFSVFGGVDLLFNNAGVALGGVLWEMKHHDWAWLIGVNIMGVANGISAFVPRMIERDKPGHIINTASAAGLVSPVGAGLYSATKHAVVAMSECLHQDFTARQHAIGVSVLCPSFVNTAIGESERSRPDNLKSVTSVTGPDARLVEAVSQAKVSADEIAAFTLAAVQRNDFYILPHPEVLSAIKRRFKHIETRQAPKLMTLNRGPPVGEVGC